MLNCSIVTIAMFNVNTGEFSLNFKGRTLKHIARKAYVPVLSSWKVDLKMCNTWMCGVLQCTSLHLWDCVRKCSMCSETSVIRHNSILNVLHDQVQKCLSNLAFLFMSYGNLCIPFEGVQWNKSCWKLPNILLQWFASICSSISK